MALKPQEKKVIDAFVDGKPEPKPNKTSYEIFDVSLEINGEPVTGTELRGPMNSVLAHRTPSGVVIWAGTGGTTYQESVFRYLKKTVPFRRFYGYPGVSNYDELPGHAARPVRK